MRGKLFNGFKLSVFILFVALCSSSVYAGDADSSGANPRSKTVVTVKTPTPGPKSVVALMAIYDSLHLNELGLNQKVFRMALKGMEKLRKMGRLTNDRILSIVDFSQPSVNKRLYVIDVDNCELLYNTLVAHGMKSGKEKALSFSNKPSSNKSSLGFYVTNRTYNGSNGYSLRLQGVEKGFNDNAAKRAIVIHGADYVNGNYITSQGYIGRSLGCPALPPELSRPLIDDIKEGSCLFIYHPTSTYLAKSQLVK
jgi:hypothetical protein